MNPYISHKSKLLISADSLKSNDCKDKNVFQVLFLFKLNNNAKLACCHTFFGAHNDGTFLLDFVPLQMLFVDDKILSVFPSL